MKREELFQDLYELNSSEKAGYQYLEKYGVAMDYAQMLYMMQNASADLDSLTTPLAVSRQRQIRQEFHLLYSGMLPEEDFFQEGKVIEVEKLFRYIDIPAHKHNFVECAFVLNGTCSHLVEDYAYIHKAGSCAIIPAYVEHYLQPSADCVCLTVKIRAAEFARMELPNISIFQHPLEFQCGDDEFVRDTLLALYAQQKKERPFNAQLMSLMFRALMTYIMQNYRDTLQHLIPYAIKNAHVMEIMNYVFENYQTVTLRSLAERFHYNQSYLSHYIRQQTGKSLSQTLQEFKLRKAAMLLTGTRLRLNEICDAVGYRDTSQFIHSFKKMYDVTPAQYRKLNRSPM